MLTQTALELKDKLVGTHAGFDEDGPPPRIGEYHKLPVSQG